MCHLLLLLPILALPVFWLWPASISVPVYAAVVAFSLSIYAALFRAMRRPVETGREGILHEQGKVVSRLGEPLAVRISGERWNAECSEGPLTFGEPVRVSGIEGLTLRVVRDRPEASAAHDVSDE
jgi:membrane-bound ClpP family serine protease